MFGGEWGGSAAAQGAFTRSDMYEGFNNQTVVNKLDGIEGHLCQGFGELDKTIYTTNAATNAALAENRFAQQQCCCETKQQIAALQAENYKNTCEITNALHAEGEATRALIVSNTVQELRDRLAERDRDLQTANYQISQFAQNQTIINALQPTPRPAYIVGSPYAAYNANSCGCNGSNYYGG